MDMHAAIQATAFHLPERMLTTQALEAEFPEWSVAKIDGSTGITERHIAGEGECASDLAQRAAEKLFTSGACTPDEVDFVLFCTQSPDYWVPTTACLLQQRLRIPTSAGALDINLGSSGYVYMLGLAQGLVASGQARCILLLTGETYTKLVNRRDRSVRTIFGDAGTATLIRAVEAPVPCIGPFVYGTDGAGGENLILRTGGARMARTAETGVEEEDESGNWRSMDNLYMNGAEIFRFTLSVVQPAIQELLRKAGKTLEEIDVFIFHQANLYILQHLRKRIGIPAEKFVIAIKHGNTACSSIPIAMQEAVAEGRLKPGSLAMLIGYGPGYSWGATLVRWQ